MQVKEKSKGNLAHISKDKRKDERPNKANPVALVTGGRQGIGLAIVEKLAAAGFNVALTARNATADIDELVQRCSAKGVAVKYFCSDLSDIPAQRRLLEEVVVWGGAIDCLVNNAGIGTLARGDLLDLTTDSFDQVMAVNLRGTFFLTQAVARWMLQNPHRNDGGAAVYRSIITISSVSAAMISTERADYCMSKTALNVMTQSFALRLAEAGVGVFELRPGIIATQMTAGVRDKYDRLIKQGLVPAKRWGEPDDIATALLPYAQGAMAFATGSALALDGALSINQL